MALEGGGLGDHGLGAAAGLRLAAARACAAMIGVAGAAATGCAADLAGGAADLAACAAALTCGLGSRCEEATCAEASVSHVGVCPRGVASAAGVVAAAAGVRAPPTAGFGGAGGSGGGVPNSPRVGDGCGAPACAPARAPARAPLRAPVATVVPFAATAGAP